MFKKALVTLIIMAGFLQVKAADIMEEAMFRSGKIYTFLTVALVVLFGIFFYLVRMDRKLAKLEDELKQKGNNI